MSSALDKLSTRERFLNSQCEHLTAEYRDAKEQLSEVQMLFNQKQDIAAELDSELSGVVKVCMFLLHLALLAYNVKDTLVCCPGVNCQATRACHVLYFVHCPKLMHPHVRYHKTMLHVHPHVTLPC